MAKDKKITITVPEATAQSSQWYTLCPWCGYKSKCTDAPRLSCSQCGQSAFALPCGTQTE